MHRRHTVPVRPDALNRLFDRTFRAAPADHEQLALVIAEHRRSPECLLQRRELQAPVLNRFPVDFEVIGHAAGPVMGQSGQRMHAVRLSGYEAMALSGALIPVIGLFPILHGL